MEIKTEVGKVLKELNYRDDVVERFDNLASNLYMIPVKERIELLASLMWYYSAANEDGTITDAYKVAVDNIEETFEKINT